MIYKVPSSDFSFRDWSDWKHNWKVRHGFYMNAPLSCKFPREVGIRLPNYIEAYDLDDLLVYIKLEDIPSLISFLQAEQAKYGGEE